MVHALYPGSFDPLHNGHLDIIARSSRAFDHLSVAVLDNSSKSNKLFTPDERVAIIEAATAEFGNVQVAKFSGLLVAYADDIKATIIVKGLRSLNDFEYELEMAQLNRHMNARVETTFMITAPAWSFVSSSRVKELARYGAEVSALVPEASLAALREKYGA